MAGAFSDIYKSKVVSAEDAIGRMLQGKRVFIGSFCGEPRHLVSALLDHTERFFDMEVVRFLNIEGSLMSLVCDETQGRSFNVRSIYNGSGMFSGMSASRRFLTPVNVYTVPQLFLKRHMPIHYALIQVSPPDDFGFVNLGISVDITLAAAQAADVVIAQVNPRMPKVPGYGLLHLNDIDLIVEKEEDLLTTFPLPSLNGSENIAKLLSYLVDDASTIHFPPGMPYELIIGALKEKNDIGIHSQFILDAMMTLVKDGVITNKKKGFNEGKMVASGAIGSEELYKFLSHNPGVEFRPADYISNPRMISRNNRMISINLASKMDLQGQVAADGIPQNHFSDVLGMVDFHRGASIAQTGKSIIVIPSVSSDGKKSNIISELPSGTVMIPAADVTYVVSEYGTVNLFGKNLQERTMAMISIAHPDFREELFSRALELGLLSKDRTLEDLLFGVYPAWLEETVEIGGHKVTFRPVKSVDYRLIQEHFYEMDKKDVYTRFFGARLHFHRSELKNVYIVDYKNSFSVVAYLGEEGYGKIVGVGDYYVERGKDLGEVAYSVSKDWQGKGIAVRLQKKIIEAAQENGLSGLYAMTMPENHSMIGLFKKMPYKIYTTYDEGDVYLKCRFDEPKE